MKLSLLIFILLASVASKAQNLVPNPGFEKNNGGKVTDWLQPLDDYYHYETYSTNVNGRVSYKSYNGLCLIYPMASEYFVIKLKQKLLKGRKYCARMDLMIPTLEQAFVTNMGSVEWTFMTEAPFVLSRAKLFAEPDISFAVEPKDLNQGFVTKEQQYVGRGNEQYLVIGKFFDRVTDSIYNAHYTRRVNLNKEFLENVRYIHDTFLGHYPPMPDYTSKKYKTRDINAYTAVVTGIDKEKYAILKDLKAAYMISMDSFDLPGIKNEFNIRTYFDNICLMATGKDNTCNCTDTIEPALVAGNTYRLNDVNFETGKYNLDTRSKAELDKLAILLSQYPEIHIVLSGHTDDVNTSEANLVLSENRAAACYDYLIASGVDASRMRSVGYGAERPVTSNKTEEGRKMNRRVEFLVE